MSPRGSPPPLPPASPMSLPDLFGAPRHLEVNGCVVCWHELGRGEPVVLLHGILDSHRSWRRTATRLAQRYRVLLPDLPGHGLSGRPDAPYTLGWHCDVLSAWMQAIGVDAAHICGHSYGAGVAMYLLLDHRPRVRRLGLVSAGGLGREVALGMRLAAIPGVGRRVTPAVLRHVLPRVLPLAARQMGNMEPEEIDHMVGWVRQPGTARAFQRCLEGVINVRGQSVGALDRVHEVDELPPIALFWGDRDPVVPWHHGQTVVQRLQGATLTTYPGSGHFPHLDHPQAFARDLATFLDDPAVPSPVLRGR